MKSELFFKETPIYRKIGNRLHLIKKVRKFLSTLTQTNLIGHMTIREKERLLEITMSLVGIGYTADDALVEGRKLYHNVFVDINDEPECDRILGEEGDKVELMWIDFGEYFEHPETGEVCVCVDISSHLAKFDTLDCFLNLNTYELDMMSQDTLVTRVNL